MSACAAHTLAPEPPRPPMRCRCAACGRVTWQRWCGLQPAYGEPDVPLWTCNACGSTRSYPEAAADGVVTPPCPDCGESPLRCVCDTEECCVCGELVEFDSERVWLHGQPAHGECCLATCHECDGQGCRVCAHWGARLVEGVAREEAR